MNGMYRFATWSLLLVTFAAASRAEETRAGETIVYRAGQDGYHTYRIPALIVSPKGTLLAFCEGRKTSRQDHGDVDLLLKRSTDGGKTWSQQQLVHEEGGDAKITIGNPCPVLDAETGTIWLPITRDNDRVLILSSTDDGLTWSTPRDITSSVKQENWTWYATGPGNGIQLTHGKYRGRLVIPCDHRVKEEKNRNLSTRSHVIYSDDHGQTWQIGGTLSAGTNECAVVELDNGDLLINMRSYRGKTCRAISRSSDGGQTWSEVTDDPNLVEPICQASLIRLPPASGKEATWLAFSNPADPKTRRNLTLRLSDDGGKTWPRSKVLCEGSSIYSSLAPLPGGDIGILYERNNYQELVFARLNPAEVK
jgi:sialidase-1